MKRALIGLAALLLAAVAAIAGDNFNVLDKLNINFSTATITGQLAVANGGTGVAASTGTGSVVLNTAPTFATGLLTKTNTAATDSLWLASSSTSTGANYFRLVNTGGTYEQGIENSTNALYGVGAYNYFQAVPAAQCNTTFVGGIGVVAKACAGGLYTTQGFFATAPNTQTGSTYTVGATDNYVVANIAGTQTATLPTASTNTGRVITYKTIQAQTVVSASSNVVPCAGGSAGTAILAATAGKWATLVSDGTNWQIMACN